MLQKFDYAIIVQLLCNFAGGVRLMNAIKVVRETTHPDFGINITVVM